MKTHISLNVSNVEKSVEFYKKMWIINSQYLTNSGLVIKEELQTILQGVQALQHIVLILKNLQTQLSQGMAKMVKNALFPKLVKIQEN